MSLYQDIKALFTLPNAYEDWSIYREDVTNYIISNSDKTSLSLSFSQNTDSYDFLPTLAIIGAGACNDYDLGQLLDHFSKITLIDCDEAAMQTALATYGLTDCPYIECVVTSLNGLNDRHYEKFCSELQHYVSRSESDFSLNEFESYALNVLEELLDDVANYEIPLSENTYDYVCCLGVHSQLHAMFSYIYIAFEKNLKEQFFNIETTNSSSNVSTKNIKNAIDLRLHEENNLFIPRLNDALLSCARHTLFIGCEKKSTNRDSAIEGAHQCLSDIKLRYPNSEETSFTWNFLPQDNVTYEMSILKIGTTINVQL